MLGCGIVFVMAGMLTSTAPPFALGLVMLMIHLDRMNRQDRADGPWDGDIDDED